jgi:uncharacterized delta-60 repeat protein
MHPIHSTRPTIRTPRVVLAVTAAAALLAAPQAARAADGALDTTFVNGGKQRVLFDHFGTTKQDLGRDVAIDSAGRIVVVGTTADTDGVHWAVTRLLGDGSIDNGFGSLGKVTLPILDADGMPLAVAVVTGVGGAGENTIWVVGATAPAGQVPVDPRAARCRVPPDGQSPVCTTLGGNRSWFGAVTTSGPAVYLGLNQVVLGDNVDFAIEKRNGTTGSLNTAWNGTGIEWFSFDHGPARDVISGLAVTSGNQVVAAGDFSTHAGDQDWFYMILTPAGEVTWQAGMALDYGGNFSDVVTSLALAPDGTPVLAGSASSDTSSDGVVVRFGATGLPKITRLPAITRVRDIAVQSDGKVVLLEAVSSFHTERLASGAPDSSYGSNGFSQQWFTDGAGGDVSVGRALALQGGKVVIVGEAEWESPDFDFGIVRLTNNLLFADGFDGGGRGSWSTTTP